MQTVTLSNNQGTGGNTPLLASELDTLNFSTLSALAPARWTARTTGARYTDSYSFTISQRVPWSGLLEVAYVGNQSRDLLNQQRRRQRHQSGSGRRDALVQERRRGSRTA